MAGDLGRPRGEEQLRRSTSKDDDPVDVFAAAACRAYQARWKHMPVRIRGGGRMSHMVIDRTISRGMLADFIDGRQFRSDQACGDVGPRPGEPAQSERIRGSTMPHRAGARTSSWLASAATWPVITQRPAFTDIRAYRCRDELRPVGRLRPGACLTGRCSRPPAPQRTTCSTGDIDLAAVGQLPAASSSCRRRSRRTARRPANFQGAVTASAVIGAESKHRARYPCTPSRRPGGSPSSASSMMSPTRHLRCGRGGRFGMIRRCATP